MKQGIHPEYVECTVKCSCGNTFVTRSTKSELKIDICNACHPFYTGTQKLIDTGGRVQRFADKFGSAKERVVVVVGGQPRRLSSSGMAAEGGEAAGSSSYEGSSERLAKDSAGSVSPSSLLYPHAAMYMAPQRSPNSTSSVSPSQTQEELFRNFSYQNLPNLSLLTLQKMQTAVTPASPVSDDDLFPPPATSDASDSTP